VKTYFLPEKPRPKVKTYFWPTNLEFAKKVWQSQPLFWGKNVKTPMGFIASLGEGGGLPKASRRESVRRKNLENIDRFFRFFLRKRKNRIFPFSQTRSAKSRFLLFDEEA
jgi:hypothetical protein